MPHDIQFTFYILVYKIKCTDPVTNYVTSGPKCPHL